MAEHFFLTTPIYYVNDRPHLGTAYTMVVADAIARWHRLAGDEVFFLTGTDEHGQKIARAAAERGLAPKEWVDQTSGWFEDAWSALQISNDAFIRTTEARHHRAVQTMMAAIRDNGYLYKDDYEGWYCVACEAYYAEDELGPDRSCPIHATPVEWLVEENYFFKLSAFEDRLLEWYASAPEAVAPESRRNEALGFIRQGLKDISVTRTSIDWGVRVPWDEDHVFYVWADALINYLTAIGYGEDDALVATWWPAIHQLLGKDIIRFHCVWWPAMCMAAGLEPPAHLFVHGWLLVGGEKMSKTRLNQIDPVEFAAEIGVDPLRYHLLRDVSLGADSDFSAEGLTARYNADLANNLGNLLSRVSTVVTNAFAGAGPAPGPADEANALAVVAADAVADATAAWDRFAPHVALEATWRIVHEANAMLEANEPWKMAPGPALERVLGDALEALRIVAVLASPAMPTASAEIWRRIGLEGRVDEPGLADPARGGLAWGGYPGGLPVTKEAPLFPRRRVDAPRS